MTFQEMIKKSGIPAAQIAGIIGIKPTNLNTYINGVKGKIAGNRQSKVVKKACSALGCISETVFFEPVFDDDRERNHDSPLYHICIALEAIRQARLRGGVIDGIAAELILSGENWIEKQKNF